MKPDENMGSTIVGSNSLGNKNDVTEPKIWYVYLNNQDILTGQNKAAVGQLNPSCCERRLAIFYQDASSSYIPINTSIFFLSLTMLNILSLFS